MLRPIKEMQTIARHLYVRRMIGLPDFNRTRLEQLGEHLLRTKIHQTRLIFTLREQARCRV